MRVDEASGIVLLQGEGPVLFEEWKAQILAALAHPTGGRRRFLSDRRHQAPAHSFATAERILAFLRGHANELGDAQWAVVAAPGSEASEIIKLIEENTRGYRVRMKSFSELGVALPWLLGVYDQAEVERLERWITGRPT